MLDGHWYKNAVIYNLNVRTFQDGNGDGIGDFGGLVRRLDYLAGLGVTAVWLMPFQPSPRRDNGYDVTDYYNVDPAYGSLGDFVEFAYQARQRGIRVLMDLVVNHTSTDHPWFQQARSDPGSRYRNYYCWSETRPPHADEGVVFPGYQDSTWSWDETARAWYHHRFYSFQADLDIAADAVQEEIRKIVGFWLELGVSGFRVDAVPFVIETDPARRDAGRRHEYLRELHDFLQWRTGDAILLAEANILPEENEKYFGHEGDRMHMIFNFQVNQHLFHALATGETAGLVQALRASSGQPPESQWAMFLRNHDELDLGRLTPEQREQVYAAFAPDPGMRIYDRGIRRRLAPMLSADRRRLELAGSLLFGLPGTPVMRYGDEIGMGEDLSLPQREAVRTAMQWTPDLQGGFTTADPADVPVVSDGPFGFRCVNVADQRRDSRSLLNWTERMIRLRKECPEIGRGRPEVLETAAPEVLAIRYRSHGNELITVHNFADRARVAALRIPDAETVPLTNLLARDHSPPGEDGVHRFTLEPYGYRWFRVGPLLDVLRHTPR